MNADKRGARSLPLDHQSRPASRPGSDFSLIACHLSLPPPPASAPTPGASPPSSGKPHKNSRRRGHRGHRGEWRTEAGGQRTACRMGSPAAHADSEELPDAEPRRRTLPLCTLTFVISVGLCGSEIAGPTRLGCLSFTYPLRCLSASRSSPIARGFSLACSSCAQHNIDRSLEEYP
jgi:hypothetical protein